ncbi:MAG: hypothetical protein VB032_06305 [Burkholderiaceae bacterium]|nr:hypothetical protein [Burkholderiaceae bacterium]
MDYKNAPNFGALPKIEIPPPRVYIRKMGGEYVEIVGVKSFERNDHSDSSGEIAFVIADGQSDDVKSMLQNPTDKYVDVKMEFLLGPLMVMKFSGVVERYIGNTISFALSTTVTTDVIDSTETLH